MSNIDSLLDLDGMNSDPPPEVKDTAGGTSPHAADPFDPFSIQYDQTPSDGDQKGQFTGFDPFAQIVESPDTISPSDPFAGSDPFAQHTNSNTGGLVDLGGISDAVDDFDPFSGGHIKDQNTVDLLGDTVTSPEFEGQEGSYDLLQGTATTNDLIEEEDEEEDDEDDEENSVVEKDDLPEKSATTASSKPIVDEDMAGLRDYDRQAYESQFNDLMGDMNDEGPLESPNGHLEHYEQDDDLTGEGSFTMETGEAYSPPASPEAQSGEVVTTSEGGQYDGPMAVSPSRLEDTLPTFQQPKRYVKPEEKRESKAAPGVIIMKADEQKHLRQSGEVKVSARASDPTPEYDEPPSQVFGSLLAKWKSDTGASPRPAQTKKAKSKVSKGAGDNRCTLCDKRVYEMEKMIADKAIYHKMCFKCSHCKRILSLGNFASMEGKVYCKPHFIEMFKTKGNYEEGFGKEKHSKQWQKDQSPDQSSTTPDDKVEDGIESVQNLSNIKSRFQGRDEKPPMPGDVMTRSQRSSVSPSNGHVNGDRTPPEVVNRSESSEDILGRELPPVNMARSLASKFRDLESSETSPSADRKPVRKITPPREDVERDVGYYHEAVERRDDVIRSDDTAEKEDELPPPSFTKNILARFKEMEDTQKPPPSPARSTSPTKRTHRPVATHTYMKSSPDEGIADTEPSTNGHQRQSTEVIRESDKNETEELPERGFTKSLVSQWRQIEQTAGSSSSGGKSPLAPRQFGTPSASRTTYRQANSQDLDDNREVVRESDNFEEENLPPPSYTKNMLAKFQNIQHEAQKDPVTTPTKKQFKWTVKEAKPLWAGANEELQLQSVNGHGETNGENGEVFSSSEEEIYYNEDDISLECDQHGNPLYPINHPQHPDNIRKRKEARRRARAGKSVSSHENPCETQVDLPAPETTKRLLSQFKSMEDVSALPPTPQTAIQRQRSVRSSFGVASPTRQSTSSIESREQPDGIETTSDNEIEHESMLREAATDMAAELPEQGMTRYLLARFQSLQAV